MSVLRLIVAWLVVAALPLQGMAAASMLFCGGAGHALPGPGAAQAHAGQARAGHAQAHARHGAAVRAGGAAGAQAGAAAPVHGAHAAPVHAGHHAGPEHGGSGAAGAQAGQPTQAEASSVGNGHACPICASCCHLAALSDAPLFRLEAVRPAPPPPQGPARVVTREAPGPDRPPRA